MLIGRYTIVHARDYDLTA